MKLAPAVALVAAAALAGGMTGLPQSQPPAAADAGSRAVGPPLPSQACFFTRDIRNHTVADSRTLYIRTDRGFVYRIGMSGACLAGATSSDPLILREHGVDRVCAPIDLDLSISVAPGIRQPCLVQSITRLTPEEISALPPRLQP